MSEGIGRASRDVQHGLELLKRSAGELDAQEAPEALLQLLNLIGGQVTTVRAAVKRLRAANPEDAHRA